MKKLSILLFTASSLFLSACQSDDVSVNCQDNQDLRRGAVCNDGTTSNATGSGACSGHGGVDYWLCK